MMVQVKNWKVKIYENGKRAYVRNNDWTYEATIKIENVVGVVFLTSDDETFKKVPAYVKNFIKKEVVK